MLAREEPVDFQGEHYQLPSPGEGTTGLGKPLKSITHPLRADIPICLGAEGPKNVALAAEIADGWLPIFLSPKLDAHYRECLAEGFARPGARRTPDDVRDPQHGATSSSTTTSSRPPTLVRMRSASTSAAWAPRRSTSTPTCSAAWATSDEVAKIQDLFLAGRKDEAIALGARWRWSRTWPWSARVDKIREELERVARDVHDHAAGQRQPRPAPPDRRDRPFLTPARRTCRGSPAAGTPSHDKFVGWGGGS